MPGLDPGMAAFGCDVTGRCAGTTEILKQEQNLA
jgi:hypothetical protein